MRRNAKNKAIKEQVVFKDRSESNSEQIRPTPTEIKACFKKITAASTHGVPVFSGWDRKLWRKPYGEIIKYLQERFKTTLSEVEYYLCAMYLEKEIPKEALYVPFKQSPQYQEMLSELPHACAVKIPAS